MRCAEKKDVKQGKQFKCETWKGQIKSNEKQFGPQITLEWARPTTDVNICTLIKNIFKFINNKNTA